MAKKRYYNSNNGYKMLHDYYSGLAGRKRMESEGSDMIHEDNNQVANLPQQVMMKSYPKSDYLHYDLNDDIRGIDVQMDDDVREEIAKTRKQYPEKY